MNIQKIIASTRQPKLYEEGNAKMWTDNHISQQLLQVHLNEELDLASRKMSTIKTTIDWILQQVDGKPLNILDLGCGPGLYAEKLAQKGHKVTGVDFSKSSIEFAKVKAKEKGLNIRYVNSDYLTLNLEENFDLVLQIYTDFGVLLPNERTQLLQKVSKFLKPGGIFIFDVLKDKELAHKISPKNWEVSDKGFWKDCPYVALSNSFLYKKEKVILYQHTVFEDNGCIDSYRFWTHFFSNEDLKKILLEYPFQNIAMYDDVLPKADLWSGDNVTFCKAVKV